MLVTRARVNSSRLALVCVFMMLSGSMGCGGSRSATIEPRYYESRDTESTWLTNTDTERTAAGNGTGESAGAGTSDNDNTTTAAAGAGQARADLLQP